MLLQTCATGRFSVLAFRAVAKDEHRAAHRVLTPRPSFGDVTRLMDEECSCAFFMWALTLYTGSDDPFPSLTATQLASVAYYAARVDRCDYLEHLTRRRPIQSLRDAYQMLFRALTPLALIKARALIWDKCRVLQWIIRWGSELDDISLFGGARCMIDLPGNGGGMDTTTGLLSNKDYAFIWSEYNLLTDRAELNVTPKDGRGTEIPLHGLQWLHDRRLLWRSVHPTSDSRLYLFLIGVVGLYSVEKIAFLSEKIQAPLVLHRAFLRVIRQFLPHQVHWHVSYRADLLQAMVTGCDDAFYHVFGDLVRGTIEAGTLDESTARCLLHRFGGLCAAASEQNVTWACAHWGDLYVRQWPLAVVAGLVVLLRGFLSYHPTAIILPVFFASVAEPVCSEIDERFACFVKEVHGARLPVDWPSVQAALATSSGSADPFYAHSYMPFTAAAVDGFCKTVN